MKEKEHYHFIGIGGIGMSALARILAGQGIKVSGSDHKESAITISLIEAGVEVFTEHSESNIPDSSTVVYSTDVKLDNLEYQKAKKNHHTLLHRSELLAKLLAAKRALLVTGTHGKTTTSSLLSHVLKGAGLDPTFAIGGIVKGAGLETNGKAGAGTHFVAEADESDGSFLNYKAYGAIITNIDNDHLNHWKTEEALQDGFAKFASSVESKDLLFWCADDEKLSALHLSGHSYGFKESADLCIKNAFQVGWRLIFDISFEGEDYEEIEIPLIGEHNVLNAAAVFGLGLKLNIPEKVLRESFKDFQGVKRRMEKKGEVKGSTIFDDYAHHPTEIATTLQALRTALPVQRIIGVFQPHRYTRVQDCQDQFASVFDSVDHLFVTCIYAAGEEPIPGITIEKLIDKIKAKTRAQVTYVVRSSLKDALLAFIQPKDILITLGAGDITHLAKELNEG